jgi:hypothetical protein
MISVLIPSRGHPDLLERSVRSLRSTASGEIEIIVRMDLDDPATMNAAWGLDVYTVTGQPLGYEGLHEYYQEMAEAANGDWLMVWNDDDQMLTPGWDEIIEALPQEVLIADPQNTHSPLCCVPAIRREAVDALGAFSTANPHVDTCWQDIGLATGRVVSVPVRVSCDSPVKPHLQHGYYDPPHQAELAKAVIKIRAAFP